MEEKAIEISFRARYYTLGNCADASKLWVVFHGYGQLAQFFIRKFKILSDLGIAIIAPEGLSKFYLEDVSKRSISGNQRVGATWMTRENRAMDIANYLGYLDAVFHKECPTPAAKEITLLGFSQGGATASRWALHGNIPFHRLILWATVFPPDMNFELGKSILKNKKIISVSGTNDPFVTDEKRNELQHIAEKLQVHPALLSFEGGHELNEAILQQLA